MKIPPPPSRQGLGNPWRSKVTTTDAVPACKPDLRRYPLRRKDAVPAAGSPAERRTAWVRYRSTLPPVRRWRTDHGVVDQACGQGLPAPEGHVCDGTCGTKTYTGRCQRDGCKSGGTCGHPGCRGYFSVQRPAQYAAPWPHYCSDACRAIADGVANRRASKRVRTGETSGKRSPKAIDYVHKSFDPDAPGAWELAYDICIATVKEEDWHRWASDEVWRAAEDYLAACEAEYPSGPSRLDRPHLEKRGIRSGNPFDLQCSR